MSVLRRILVDGGSGAGKTTFASRLRDQWEAECGLPVQLVSLDAFYPGWHGLAAASRMVVDDVLASTRPGYWQWDWDRGRQDHWVPLDASLPMVVEGCGAITPASAALSDLKIWLQLDASQRRARALGRPDGDGFAPWWETWARQEQEHWDAHHPELLADLVVPARSLL